MRNKSDQAPPLYLPIGDQTWIFMPPSNDSVLVATASRASFPMISTTNPPSSASSSEMGQKQTKTASSFVRQAVGAAGVVVTDRSRNGNPEQKRCKTRGSFPPAPHRVDYLLDLQPVDKQTREEHSWNPNDRSLNVFIKEDDPTTIHRHPVAQSTDCARGRRGYSGGIHAWEFQWNTRQRGTHAVVGVATKDAPLHCVGYQSLVGSTADSWGWDLGRNKLYHDSKNIPGVSYPRHVAENGNTVTSTAAATAAAAAAAASSSTSGSSTSASAAAVAAAAAANNGNGAGGGTASADNFVVPDKFHVVLDMDEGTLSFVVDGKYLGVAFRGLKGKKLYPIVSAVWGHCEITTRYIGGLDRKFLNTH